MGRLTRIILGGTLLAAAVAVAAPAIAAPHSVTAAAGKVTPGVSFAATDQVIVSMRPGQAANPAALGRAAGQSVQVVRMLSDRTVVLKLPGVQSDARLEATVRAMAGVDGVAWAEPDVRMSALAADPLRGDQWDLNAPSSGVYGIDLDGAIAQLGAPAAITVAVVDTGVVEHQDLAGVFLPGYDFIGDVQVANDGDGRDADAHDPGDWITSTESRSGYFRRCPTGDSSWHGTHVSGTIAALTGNGTGITGINPTARILPVRVLGKCGGYTSDITDGVRWAAGLSVSGVPANQHPARVINLSLGGSGSCSATWQSAVDAATAAGTVVVVAAGNSNANAANYSPASCAGVITVASTGQTGSRAYYSNYGSTVEIAAPGGDKYVGPTILSTLNSGTTSPVPGGDIYVRYQGTSMATPHVVGVVSLLLAANPSLTPAEVTGLLQQSATPFPAGSTCSTSTCGAGILNAAAAVTALLGTPPPPTTAAPTTTAGPTTTSEVTTTTAAPTTTAPSTAPGAFSKSSPNDGKSNVRGSVTLSWQSSAGATQYWVCVDTSADSSCTAFTYGPYTGTSVKFTGLTSGTTYEWQVLAVNGGGQTEADQATAWTFSTR